MDNKYINFEELILNNTFISKKNKNIKIYENLIIFIGIKFSEQFIINDKKITYNNKNIDLSSHLNLKNVSILFKNCDISYLYLDTYINLEIYNTRLIHIKLEYNLNKLKIENSNIIRIDFFNIKDSDGVVELNNNNIKDMCIVNSIMHNNFL